MADIKGIIFDFNRTIYDPEAEKLTEGALDLLKRLKAADYKLALISGAGDGETREGLIKSLGIDQFFDYVEIVKTVKNETTFQAGCDYIGLKPEEIAVVGDRVRRGIRIGNNLGMLTIWYKQGKFATELPESDMDQPDYTITRLKEVLDYV